MKLIIDIPDEMYDCIKKDTESEMYIIDVIKKGTPIETDKQNCVTCDHFGKCEGCEKREEE